MKLQQVYIIILHYLNSSVAKQVLQFGEVPQWKIAWNNENCVMLKVKSHLPFFIVTLTGRPVLVD